MECFSVEILNPFEEWHPVAINPYVNLVVEIASNGVRAVNPYPIIFDE